MSIRGQKPSGDSPRRFFLPQATSSRAVCDRLDLSSLRAGAEWAFSPCAFGLAGSATNASRSRSPSSKFPRAGGLGSCKRSPVYKITRASGLRLQSPLIRTATDSKCRRATKPKALNGWSHSAYARRRRHFESVASLRVAQRPAVSRRCGADLGQVLAFGRLEVWALVSCPRILTNRTNLIFIRENSCPFVDKSKRCRGKDPCRMHVQGHAEQSRAKFWYNARQIPTRRRSPGADFATLELPRKERTIR